MTLGAVVDGIKPDRCWRTLPSDGTGPCVLCAFSVTNAARHSSAPLTPAHAGPRTAAVLLHGYPPTRAKWDERLFKCRLQTGPHVHADPRRRPTSLQLDVSCATADSWPYLSP